MEWKSVDDMAFSAQKEFRTLIAHLSKVSWLMNPAKIECPAQSVNFLGIMWTRSTGHIFQIVRNTSFSFIDPANNQETQILLRLFTFWRNHTHQIRILFKFYSKSKEKQSDKKKKKAFSGVLKRNNIKRFVESRPRESN